VYYIKAISNNYVRIYGKRRNQFKPGYIVIAINIAV